LPICYQLRDEAGLQLRKSATKAVVVNLLSVTTGTVAGTWIAIPPTQERQETSSIVPILVGVGVGELVGLILALLVIWVSRE
jgi:hypothetical protein